ncbi:hypothetical protein LOK49_LG07G02357 [Camellia lanceoleosa]|uniref:Uncharacterized protein n=1 Tax=Camellia lanceoleosa TaxID=1840588 RepID=A0ACC0H3K1_9ERIC|nr:hypothetical protein LOK49_LG07G02357 [Camellia lanceoleosa]
MRATIFDAESKIPEPHPFVRCVSRDPGPSEWIISSHGSESESAYNPRDTWTTRHLLRRKLTKISSNRTKTKLTYAPQNLLFLPDLTRGTPSHHWPGSDFCCCRKTLGLDNSYHLVE